MFPLDTTPSADEDIFGTCEPSSGSSIIYHNYP